MVLTGTIVNAIAVVVGALIGFYVKGLNQTMAKTIMQGLSLAVIIIGITMGLSTNNPLIIIFSLVLGGLLGELLKIEDGLNKGGRWIEQKLVPNGEGKIATAFITTTLIYCVGSMAILGALESGLKNEHQIYFTKALLDGFSAIIFTSTLGIGVLFSGISVLLYQGILTLSATYISRIIPTALLNLMIDEITATGGLLIMAIGLNLLELTKIRIASFLPAIFIAALLVPVFIWLKEIFPFLQ